VRKLLINKINLIDIHFGNFLAILNDNRNTHKLFKYDVAVTKLSCLIVFIVICTKNFWKADMEQFNQITFSALNKLLTKLTFFIL